MSSENRMNLEFLLTKYLEKNCTPEDKNRLYELVLSSNDERLFKEILFSHLCGFIEEKSTVDKIDFDGIYNQILSEIKHQETKSLDTKKRLPRNKIMVRRLVSQVFSIAAVFCIAFFLGSYVNQRNIIIPKEQPSKVIYTEIKVPLGAKSEIKLTDGTEVILNAGSTLKYRSNYNSNNRDLILEGEAYFKVAKNANLPLIVEAGKINIKAIGTEFNVKAYSDEGIIETTLIEGKVEISQKDDSKRDEYLVLKPNQKAIYLKESDQITLEKIREIEPAILKSAKIHSDKLLVSQKTDIDQVIAWTHNRLIIRSENLESLCIKLQRKYDVNFIFGNDEIKKYRFTGVLLDESLEQVLNIIKLTAPVNYLIDGKTVVLASNKNQIENYIKYLRK
jgi:transmembrane sensor